MQQALDGIYTYMQQCLTSDQGLLQQLAAAVLQHKGKFIRPQLTILVAGMLSGSISEKALRGAAIVSLLHHASLIHDDVIDEAHIRRFAPTVNAQFGNQSAVLWGDYILASILRFIASYKDYDYVDLFAKTVQDMIEGEVMQLAQAQAVACSEERYMRIIEKKTGSLMAMACMVGAIAANTSQKQQETVFEIGNLLGIAFQLADDLVDYDCDTATGKMPFMDLKAHRFTLPLIHSLEQAQPDERRYIQVLITSDEQPADITELVCKFIHQHGGKAYTQAKIAAYHQEVLHIANYAFTASDYQLQFIKLLSELFPSS